MRLAYGHYRDTQKKVTAYHRTEGKVNVPPTVSYPKDLNPENLKADNVTINSITVTNSDGKSTTYNKDEAEGPAAPGDHTIIIKKDGAATETTATFTEGTDPETPLGAPNTIILKYKKDNEDKCITITGKAKIVPFGHIFTETFDTSKVRPEIISPTLMVIVGIMKSQGIYDPYVFMGNWGGKHVEDKAAGYLTLTPKNTGTYTSGSSNQITINISSAAYTNKVITDEQNLDLSTDGNTLKLTSDGDINERKTYTITREANGLTLTLKSANENLKDKTYNVFLNIATEITLTGTSTCKIKKTPNPVSLGTYSVGNTGGTNFTGTPQDSTNLHDRHKNANCCIFGKQNIWKLQPGMYSWHSPLYFMCHEISLAIGFPLTRKGATSTYCYVHIHILYTIVYIIV